MSYSKTDNNYIAILESIQAYCIYIVGYKELNIVEMRNDATENC